jgi:hypothetical protein
MLQAKRTLKDRVLWQRSFRSVTIDKDWAFRQKMDYIHNNPVKRGLCDLPASYRWSSAWMVEEGHYLSEGLDLDVGIRVYEVHNVGQPPQGVAG